MNPMDIVCTTFNRLEFTKAFIESLHDRTKTPFRLTVVDNKSTDGSQSYLYSAYKDGLIANLLLLPENYGIHMAKNYGLALVRSEPYYIDTDNDLLPPLLEPDWITQLIELMDKNPDYGAISCRPQVLVGSGENRFSERAPEVVKFGHVGAHLRIMRTDKVRECGGWEKTWEAKRNHEDTHIATQLENIGLSVGYAKDVRCFHMFGQNWGYKDMPLEEHGHRDMWPPAEHWDTLKDKLDPNTWQELS